MLKTPICLDRVETIREEIELEIPTTFGGKFCNSNDVCYGILQVSSKTLERKTISRYILSNNSPFYTHMEINLKVSSHKNLEII